VLHTSYQELPAQPDILAAYNDLAQNKGDIPAHVFAALYGSTYEQMQNAGQVKPFTLNSTLNDLQGTLIGKILRGAIVKTALKSVANDAPERQLVAWKMLEEVMTNMPLRAMVTSSGGTLTMGMAEGVIRLANGRFARGCWQLLRSLPRKQ
jgi:hypothetical protein